jgi:hypothetical protein
MPALRLCLFAIVLLVILVLACGGDDDDESEPTPTRTATASRITATPSPGGSDEKTPPPGESPGETPVDTGAPLTPATSGTPAPQVEDVAAFFAQFSSPPEDERRCVYTPSSRVIDCSDRGQYAPDPPPGGQGNECFLMAVSGSPVALRCEAADPQLTTYYDIR